jgi:K+-transporting ATPase KdpF subunit
MSLGTVFLLIISGILIGYLLYALLKAEQF